MRELKQEELKATALQIMKDIHAYCEKNHLTYFLCGGTLLGAVRHQGFIPWDDDIDICMPRTDYEKFLVEYTSDHYTVLSHKKNQGYYLPFAKVIDNRTRIDETLVKSIPGCGVFVDVFPLDGLSDDMNTAKRIVKKAKTYMHANAIAICLPLKNKTIKNMLRNLLIWFLSFNEYDSWAKRIEELSRHYPFATSRYVGCAFGYYGYREIHRAEVFADRQLLRFEDSQFYAPIGTKEYLTSFYGDYMTPPPVEKQMAHHSFRAYWKE